MKRLDLQKCIVGSVFTNCYFLKNKETEEMLIVDPGDNADRIEQKVLEMQGRPVAILLTHGHFDHILAAEEIKKKYPLVFEMGVRAGNFLSEQTNLEINENEIGFFALHLGSAYDRSSASGKYKVLMIYPDDQALSKLCAQKVETRFSERMEIIDHMSFFEEAQVEALQPDMILTTLPLMHSLGIPTIQISLFVNFEDESRIFHALNHWIR